MITISSSEVSIPIVDQGQQISLLKSFSRDTNFGDAQARDVKKFFKPDDPSTFATNSALLYPTEGCDVYTLRQGSRMSIHPLDASL